MREIFFLFIITAGADSFLIHNCTCLWTAQILPVNPDVSYCLKFRNQNTCLLSTGNYRTNYIPKILKTTTGGDKRYIIKESLKMILTKNKNITYNNKLKLKL